MISEDERQLLRPGCVVHLDQRAALTGYIVVARWWADVRVEAADLYSLQGSPSNHRSTYHPLVAPPFREGHTEFMGRRRLMGILGFETLSDQLMQLKLEAHHG